MFTLVLFFGFMVMTKVSCKIWLLRLLLINPVYVCASPTEDRPYPPTRLEDLPSTNLKVYFYFTNFNKSSWLDALDKLFSDAVVRMYFFMFYFRTLGLFLIFLIESSSSWSVHNPTLIQGLSPENAVALRLYTSGNLGLLSRQSGRAFQSGAIISKIEHILTRPQTIELSLFNNPNNPLYTERPPSKSLNGITLHWMTWLCLFNLPSQIIWRLDGMHM